MRYIKYVLVLLTFLIVGCSVSFATSPSFDDNFAQYLTDDTPDSYGRVETVFSLCIDKDISLMANIRNLFYPNAIAVSTSC